MTLPRHLSLLGDNKIDRDRLKIEPAGDIESLRSEHKNFKDIHLPANNEVVIHEVQGSAMEIITEIEINASPMIELNVLRSPNKEEFTRIAFYANRGYRDWERYDQWESDKRFAASEGLITIDSSYSSVLPDVLSRAPETGPVFLDTDENLKLRVFIDKSIVEVFVNSKQCIAMRVYPGRSESTGISLRSQGKDAKIKTLDTWQMKDIYSD